MAATITMEHMWKHELRGGGDATKLEGTFKMTFDSAYVSGGEGISVSRWFRKIHHITPVPAEDGTSGGYNPAVTDTNFAVASTINIELFCQSSNATMAAFNEVTAGRQAQSVVMRLHIIGE